MIPNYAFELNLDMELHDKSLGLSDVQSLAKNMDLKTNNLHYSDDAEDYDAKIAFDISTSSQGVTDASLHYNANSIPKIKFIERRIETYKQVAAYLLEENTAKLDLKSFLESFLEDPSKYFPTSVDAKNIEINLDLKLHIQDQQLKLDVDNLTFLADKTGFVLKGKNLVDKKIMKAEFDGMVFIYNYKDIIDFTTDYENRIHNQNASKDRLDLEKEVYKDFLRAASDHPDSNSQNAGVSYTMGSNLASLKLGQYTAPEALAIYYNLLYLSAIQKAKTSPDFDAKLKELAPGLAANPKLLKSLMKETK